MFIKKVVTALDFSEDSSRIVISLGILLEFKHSLVLTSSELSRRRQKLGERSGVKVLFLLNHLGSGGAEGSLALSLPTMVENGLTAVVAYFQEETAKEVHRQRFEACSKIEPIPGRSRLERIVALRELVQRVKPDVMHSALMEANLLSRFACIGTETILLNSLVSMSYTKARFLAPKTNRLKHRCLQLVDGLTGLFLVDHFHAVNQAVKDEAVRSLWISPDRISVVYRGRPSQVFEAARFARIETRRRLGIDDHTFLVFTAGRQSFIKGHMDLLVAFSALVKDHKDIKLVVAGREGNQTQSLSSFVKTAGLDGKAFFLGHRDDVPELLAASDLFVFPSHLEGIGGAVIEAMAAGLPIVASDIPGLRETLGLEEEWTYVPPANPERLASAIAGMKNNEALRTRLGRANRERYESEFVVEPNAIKMMDLYRAMLHARTTKSRFSSPA